MKRRTVKRLIRSVPTADPSQDLAARIKESIPDHLDMTDAVVRDMTRTGSERRDWRLALAAVLVVALAGTIVWRLVPEPGPAVVAGLADEHPPAPAPDTPENADSLPEPPRAALSSDGFHETIVARGWKPSRKITLQAKKAIFSPL